MRGCSSEPSGARRRNAPPKAGRRPVRGGAVLSADEGHTEPGWRPEEEKGPSLLSRRDFIKRTVQVAVAGALIPGTAAQVLPSLAPSAFAGGGAGPIILRDPKTNAKRPVTLEQLTGDAPFILNAEWNFLPAIVYKVPRAVLEGSARVRGYNTAQYAVQHPDDESLAIMVYDGKCKHLGCTVGWDGSLPASGDVADYNEDGKNDGRILCPCHQGQYDIYNLALNVPGTPPPEPLNVIEFDIRESWTDEETGSTYNNVIYGVEKYLQSGEAEASGASPYSIPLEQFMLRIKGWSQ